ncbi:MAG TPA: hypothetical protein ENG90_04495 [Gammaproteobacteria bacterium]|nr:hypothetical protein BMS3Abin11_02010 [bacterium BMS3Abin11]GMT40816.1 MAG: hypothetical protein IEMM0001_1551 [bacterium]HDH15725.1 hypothetical protein [Gammaproteobacteria bacterium]
MYTHTILKKISHCLLISCFFVAASLSGAAFAEVKIDHKPVKDSTSGKRIDLSAKFKDKSAGISKAFAYFNSDLDTLWHSVPMSGDGNKYSGQLPAPDIYTSFINYRFLVVNEKDQIQAGEVYTIAIKKDEKALARLQRKPPTDVKIDVSEIQDAKDMADKIKRERISSKDQKKEANQSTRPNPGSRVKVLSEYKPSIDSLKGFRDYVNLYYTPKAYGATAGIIDPSATVSGAGAGTYTGAAAAGGGGVSTGVLLGGLAVAGGAAVAAGASGGDSGGSSGGGPTGSVCSTANASGRDAPQTITVDLGKTSGTFGFSWNMVSIKDRMVLTTSTLTPLFDTGCVSGSGSVSIPFTDSSGKIRVTVQPNCAGGSGTAWSFKVRCP